MKKQVYTMLVAIIALGLIALIALNVGPNKREQRKIQEPILGKVKIKDVKTIIINGDVRLTKSADVWNYIEVTNIDGKSEYVPKPTRQDYAQEMLDIMSKTTRGKLVDSNPDDLAKYHLREDDGMRIMELQDAEDTTLMTIKVGVITGAISKNYAQIDDNESVYKIDDELIFYLNQSSQYWLDLRLFPNGIEAEEVKSIKISKKNNDSIYLSKDKKEWMMNDDAEKMVSASDVESYLNDLSVIKANSFYPIDLQEDYREGRIEIELNDGSILEVKLYSFANQYLITTIGGQENEVLHFQEYSIEKMFPKSKRFQIITNTDDEANSDSDES